MNLAEMSYRVENGIPVIQASGEIDLSNVDRLSSFLEEAAVLRPAAAIVSLERLTYLDSTTFYVLLKYSDAFKRGAAELLVVMPASESVKRLFGIVHLDGAIRTFDTLAAATERANQLRMTC